MKILIATDWYKPIVNGVVTSVTNLERELLAKGHDVRILTLSNSLHSRKEGNVYYIKSVSADKLYPGARASIYLFGELYDEILKWAPDIIHTQAEFTTFIFAKRIVKALGIPHVHTYHTVYEDYTHYFSINEQIGKKTVAYLSRRLLDALDEVIVPTAKVKRLLEGYGVIPRISVIPSGIRLDSFYQNTNDLEQKELKSHLGIAPDKKVLVYVGRLAKEKNLDELLDYYKRLDRNDTVLLITGIGPYRSRLEKLVDAMELTDRVIFVGLVEPSTLHKYYKLGDIFVSCSTSETQGLTYIEALACGVPPICRRDLALEGVINDGINGYQYDTFEEFKSRVEELLSDETKRTEISGRAVENSLGYSTGIFADSVEELYSRVLNKHNDIADKKEGRLSSLRRGLRLRRHS
ncbi:glycosyltransferase family 4 protein [Gudongella oleilytica]|uniref:glycosyltransferase family 4 protein n=1 Tax=Gudongella oleilytica TaxID=1582259 RepID=UPI002A3665E3|nr:glycosyltransferase family 4 protein [Gudongella oleilytica]MDY0256010.1 glycosyltransferase family 4 protein [Gudongella oleilytica]HMM69342.1 glycosyltransferase family 4 protein [Gudongella oleilytica]